ncbi:MAG: RnfABCDGE type electron transport complex subunit [Clostridia bacterium]|jgi:electron transport complex protein RnfG|nr:RnfABCDGE type electron transport complex subunit [Clostridia bacterium]
MKESLKLGAILFFITAICVGLLGFVNTMTTPIIAHNKEVSEQAAMKELIADADDFTKVEDIEDEKITELYVANGGGQAIGTVVKMMPNGYGGPITVLIGLNTEGQIKGVKILSHAETPGLGANATADSFLGQFIQKTPPLAVVKSTPKDNEIEAITGATITSSAVAESVNDAAQYVQDHKQDLLMGGK